MHVGSGGLPSGLGPNNTLFLNNFDFATKQVKFRSEQIYVKSPDLFCFKSVNPA